mgnify:CR=1 FL=1
MDSMILLVAMIAVFYFLIIRPENKRKKQAENMRNSLKKGERITTIGGLVGRIVQVNDATVVFETSEDRVRIEVASLRSRWSRRLRPRPRRLTRRRRRLRKSLRPRKRPRRWLCRSRIRRKRLKSPRISPLTILRSSKIDNCIA